jgi:hypothetical protein
MNRNRARTSVWIALLLTAGACASGGTTGSNKPKTSSTRITKAEINATSASSAYDVVSQLHPDWLRPPRSTMSGAMGAAQAGSTSMRTPLVLVYVDGVRMGGLDQLRSLSAASITSIEYADATRVASVVRDLGAVAPDAAILVSTKQ